MQKQLDIESGFFVFAWRLVGGIIAPVCVFVVFVYTLLPVFEALPAYFSGIIESIQARIN